MDPTRPLKNLIKKTALWSEAIVPLRQHRAMAGWLQAGRPNPPPQPAKARMLLALADLYDLDCLVETGTYLGETIEATVDRFKTIDSIEIYAPLADAARKKFAARPNVVIHTGDSAVILPALASSIAAPALFWLDGHYSGAGTGMAGASETPIRAELLAIAGRQTPDVIVIDDAHEFGRNAAYPSVEEIWQMLASPRRQPPRIANNAIIILPA